MDVAVLSREKKKIVIIGANEFQLPLVEAAARRGLETHVFAWEEGAVAREAADFFYPVSIVEKEKILSLAAPLRPAAAATIGSDLAGITVNYLTNRLSLPGNPPETAVLATDKPAMREAFRAAGLYTPRFLTFARGKNACRGISSIAGTASIACFIKRSALFSTTPILLANSIKSGVP